MKKIMKKALSLMLALVMVFSLAPMTAKAEETVVDTQVVEDVTAGQVGGYFLMPDAGTYKVTVTGATGFVVMGYWENPFSQTRLNDDGGEVEFTVTTNPRDPMGVQSIDIGIMNLSDATQNYTVKVTAEAAGGGTGSGTEGTEGADITDIGGYDSPVSIPTVGTYNVAISNGMNWLTWTATEDGTFSVSISEEDFDAGRGAGVESIISESGIVYPDSATTATQEVEVKAGDVCKIVCFAGMSDTSLTVTLAFAPKTVEATEITAVGEYDSPVALPGLGVYNVAIAYGMNWLTWTATEDGTFSVSVSETDFAAGKGAGVESIIKANSISYPDSATTATHEVEVKAGDVCKIVCFAGMSDTSLVITLDFTAGSGTGSGGGATEGNNTSADNPATIIMGENTAVVTDVNPVYYYSWTATEAGYLYLTMKTDECSNGWGYDGMVNKEYFDPTSWGWFSTDEEPVSLRTLVVTPGDLVEFMVFTPDYSAGSIQFSAFFWADASVGGSTKEEYVVDSETMLQLGTNVVELDPSAETTIFEFNPEETGLYKFTTDNGVVGYWGGGAFFVSDQTENKTATLQHNYDELGPSIMVGVTGEGEATIKVERVGDPETKPTIPTIVYTNTTTPEYLEVFDTEISLENTVNVGDFTEDTAVLGADGYYHLNSADGPVLFVHLNNDRISLFSAYGYGRVNGVITNADNETIAIVDYNEAFMEYYSAAHFVDITEDIANAYYPVTEDLATMLKDVSEKEGWYLFIEEAMFPDETWMVLCCYDATVTSIDEELEEAEVEDANVVIKDSGKITADSLEAIIETTTSDNVIFTVETGDKTVSYEFVVEDLELIDGKETYDFSVELVDDYAGATEDEADIDEDRFVLRVNFSYEGDLPATAIISIPVGTDYAGKTLGYYEVLADGTLKHLCDTVVDAEGIAKVTQDHCSDYVLLAPATVADGGTGTGDATNFALWIAVLGLGVVAIAGSVVMRKKEF